MSLLDIAGSNIFGEDLESLLVPIDDSPQVQEEFRLLSFEDTPQHSTLGENDSTVNNTESDHVSENQVLPPNSGSEVQRKRSATLANQKVEQELQSWFYDADNPNIAAPSLMPGINGPPPTSNSPNPRFKKKVKTVWVNGRQEMVHVEEAYVGEEEEEAKKTSPPQLSTSPTQMNMPSKVPMRTPIPRNGYIDPSALEAFAADSQYAGNVLSTSPVSSPYAPSFNSVPVQRGYVTPRRRSIPGSRAAPNQYPVSNQYLFKENSAPNVGQRIELDANYAKVQLMEMGFPERRKDPKAYCQQVVQFICSYCKIFVGGFYLNNNSQSPSATVPWILSCTFPNANDFNQYFHYNVGERFIMQAATEKRCFCVHSSSWENNTGLLSFLFVPIPNEGSSGAAIAVMVLGTILGREEDLHTHLLFLDQIRRPIASTLRTLLHIQHDLYKLQKLDVLNYEGEGSKPLVVNTEKALINVLGALQVNVDEYAVITTNLKGMITYWSSGAQRILGYSAEEMINKHQLVQLHDLIELNERSKELEQELGRPCPADFNVLIQRTIANRGADDTRIWHWMKKDRTMLPVQVIMRPMSDDNSVFGFMAIAKEYQGQEDMRLDDSRK